MRYKDRDNLDTTTRDRILFVFAAPPLIAIFALALWSVHDAFGGRFANGKAARVFDLLLLALFSELFIAIIALLVLGFIWGLFDPRWVHQALASSRHHIWFAFCFFVAGFIVLLVALYATA